jgi:hypothetical protein
LEIVKRISGRVICKKKKREKEREREITREREREKESPLFNRKSYSNSERGR